MIGAVDAAGEPLWQAVFGPGIDQLLLHHDRFAKAAYIPIVDHRNSVVATWNTTTGTIDELAEYDPRGRTHRLIDAPYPTRPRLCSHCPLLQIMPL